LASSRPAILDAAAYHCQQAAEKALKAYLVYWDQRVAKIHDIGVLLDQAMGIEPALVTWQDAADRLTPLAMQYRYPGPDEAPILEEFEEALDDATAIVEQVLSFLPDEVHPAAEDA
jgi:HEPN domain-containing protein